MKLSELIEKMNDVYTDSREQLATIHEALNAAQETEQRTRIDKHLTEADRHKRLMELQSECFRLRDKAAGIEQKAHTMIDEIAEQAAAANTPKAADVDSAALALIDSGVLTAPELLRFGEQYAGNSVMQRLIGAKLLEISENGKSARFDTKTAAALRDEGRRLQIAGNSTPAADTANEFAKALKYGCRAEKLLADNVHNTVYESALADARAAAAELDAEPTA